MQFGADHVRVRVPATSANLGPGFDSLGLALALYDEVEVTALASTGTWVEVYGEGAGQVPSDDHHLVVRAVRAALEYVGAPQIGVHVVCRNAIPHGRGLGSSAAAAVAGIMAARGLIADASAITGEEILRLATEFEGHPDNAAPAIVGGATIGWIGAEGARAARFEVSAQLDATVLIPTFRLATTRARRALPEEVPHADAAFNVGRAALLTQALAGRVDLLWEATEDRLHQEYRRPVMKRSLELVDTLRSAGLAAVVSGAGPTVLVLSDAAERLAVETLIAECVGAASAWQIMRIGVDTQGCVTRRISQSGQ